MVAPRLNQRSDKTKCDSIDNRRQVAEQVCASRGFRAGNMHVTACPEQSHIPPVQALLPPHRFHSVGNILWKQAAPGKRPGPRTQPSAAVALPQQLS
jgi:hypothetical protein